MKIIKRLFCDKKISDYYEYMAETIGKTKTTTSLKIINDENELVKLLKCPMTDTPLILENSHLKASVTIFNYSTYSIPKETTYIF